MISVVMPAYNAEKYIADAIESILCQTYNDFEFIIVNDGSTDKTADIIRSFKDKHIIFIDRNENRGLVYSLNEGIRQAKGDFIARMDADDVSVLNRFELQIDYLINHPDIDICGGSYKCFGTDNRLVEAICDPEKISEYLFRGCVMFHPTIMMRKCVVYQSELYIQDYMYAEDYELWCRLLKKGIKFGNIPDVILNYRVTDTHISAKYNTRQQFLTAAIVLRNFCWQKKINFDDKSAVGNDGEKYCCKQIYELRTKINYKDNTEIKNFLIICYMFIQQKQIGKLKKVKWLFAVIPLTASNVYRMLKIACMRMMGKR